MIAPLRVETRAADETERTHSWSCVGQTTAETAVCAPHLNPGSRVVRSWHWCRPAKKHTWIQIKPFLFLEEVSQVGVCVKHPKKLLENTLWTTVSQSPVLSPPVLLTAPGTGPDAFLSPPPQPSGHWSFHLASQASSVFLYIAIIQTLPGQEKFKAHSAMGRGKV